MDERDLITRAMDIIPKVLYAKGLQARLDWITTGRNGQRYLIAVIDEEHALLANKGTLSKFHDWRLTHDIETLMGGHRIVFDNHSGLRFIVPLNKAARVPSQAALPDGVEHNTLPIGVGMKGPAHIHARDYISGLITGAQGSGKSTHLKALAFSALRHGWSLYLADARGHTFNPDTWNALTAAPMARSEEELLIVAEALEAELKHREELFRAMAEHTVLMPEDLEEYNREAARRGLDPLPYFMFIADEANSFLTNEVVRVFTEVVKHGRKWGLLVAMGAHSWRGDDISRSFSMLFHTRLCFRVDDDTTGTVALSSKSWGRQAMKLKEKGRGLFALGGQTPQLIQGYYLERERERALLMAALQGRRPGPSLTNEEITALEAARAAGGKISNEVLVKVNLSPRLARRIIDAFAQRGWARKDPMRNNAYFLTEKAPPLITG